MPSFRITRDVELRREVWREGVGWMVAYLYCLVEFFEENCFRVGVGLHVGVVALFEAGPVEVFDREVGVIGGGKGGVFLVLVLKGGFGSLGLGGLGGGIGRGSWRFFYVEIRTSRGLGFRRQSR